MRSALIPRAIGVALIVGGAGAASCVLWPPFVPATLAPVFLLGAVAELVLLLLLWPLIIGGRALAWTHSPAPDRGPLAAHG